MSSEDVFRVVLEVKDRHDVGISDFFDLGVGIVTHLAQGNVELVVKDWV